MKANIQTLYQRAIRFAGERHGDQKMPSSNASYLVHLAHVAMEVMVAAPQSTDFDLEFALQVALLHDVIEDTPTTLEEVRGYFSEPVAEAVLALTKNELLPANEQIPDSLKRKHQEKVQPAVVSAWKQLAVMHSSSKR